MEHLDKQSSLLEIQRGLTQIRDENEDEGGVGRRRRLVDEAADALARAMGRLRRSRTLHK